MSDYKRDQYLFELVGKISGGNEAAVQEARSLGVYFFWSNFDCLLIVASDIEGVYKAFTFCNGQSFSFFMPTALSLKEVRFDENVLHFTFLTGVDFYASIAQLCNSWNELPFGGNRITSQHVETAFLSCNKVHHSDSYTDEMLGVFSYAYGVYSQDGFSQGGCDFAISAHVADRDRLRALMSSLNGLVSEIAVYDATAKDALLKAFAPTVEELAMLSLGYLDYYEKGEFDLTYALPEGSAMEYVRVCFNDDRTPAETTFGNF